MKLASLRPSDLGEPTCLGARVNWVIYTSGVCTCAHSSSVSSTLLEIEINLRVLSCNRIIDTKKAQPLRPHLDREPTPHLEKRPKPRTKAMAFPFAAPLPSSGLPWEIPLSVRHGAGWGGLRFSQLAPGAGRGQIYITETRPDWGGSKRGPAAGPGPRWWTRAPVCSCGARKQNHITRFTPTGPNNLRSFRRSSTLISQFTLSYLAVNSIHHCRSYIHLIISNNTSNTIPL